MSKAFLVPTAAKRPVLLARPALVDAAGKPLSMSDSQKEELQLGQSFASVRQITEGCTAIRNTRFQAPATKPDWFDGLNGKLEALKHFANTWLDDYAIAITSTIPTSIMTFVPVYDASAKVLRDIIQRSPDELSPSDAVLAREVIARMVGNVHTISTKVEYYAKVDGQMVASGKLIDWQKNMRAARDALDKGSDSIQNARTDLKADIEEYKGKITTLKAEIEQYNKMVALGAGLVGGGIFVGVVGLGFCFAFPWVGGILIAVGAGMVIGGAVTWGVMQKKINKANREIVDYTAKIAEGNKTILALDSLSTAAHTCLDSADSAIQNMTDFAATWATFGSSLRATMAALEQGGKEAYGALLAMDLDEAQENWDDVKDYAKKLQSVPSEIKVVPAGETAA